MIKQHEPTQCTPGRTVRVDWLIFAKCLTSSPFIQITLTLLEELQSIQLRSLQSLVSIHRAGCPHVRHPDVKWRPPHAQRCVGSYILSPVISCCYNSCYLFCPPSFPFTDHRCQPEPALALNSFIKL